MDAGPATDAGTTPAWAPDFYTTFNHSGSRLKAQAITDDNGNSVVLYFEDTTLGVRCMPGHVQNEGVDEVRCLPEAVIDHSPDPAFLDASCAEPAIVVPTGCADTTYVTDRGAVYYSAAMEPAGTPTYRLNALQGCEPGPTSGVDTPVYRLTPVDYASFVRFTRNAVPLDGFTAIQVMEGEDGSSMAVGLWSVADNRGLKVIPYTTPATEMSASRMTLRLFPESPFSSLPRIFVQPFPGSEYSAFVAEDINPVPTVVELGGAGFRGSTFVTIVGTQDTYLSSTNVEITVPPGRKVYRMGSAANLTAFPQVTLETGTGPNLNLQHYLVDGQSGLLPAVTLANGTGLAGSLDSMVGEVSVGAMVGADAVSIFQLGDDVVAVPSGNGYYGFSDQSCEIVVAVSDFGATPGDFTFSRDEDGCAYLSGTPLRIDRVYQVDDVAPQAGALYYIDQSGSCIQYMNGSVGPYQTTSDITADVGSVLPALTVAELPPGP